MRATSLILAAALLAAACGTPVVNPVSGRTERSVMDESAEIAEGKKAHAAVMQEFGGPLANPKLQAYVNDVGQRLARQSHRANLEWTFTVLDSPDINAFALPGGYVYVTRGIMAYMDSEADLAGVVGHEIGHVTARHGAQRATRQQTAGVGVMAATVLGVLIEAATGMQGAAQAANQMSSGVAMGTIASYSRDQELQADKLGAEYLSRVGYNPKHMVDVITLLATRSALPPTPPAPRDASRARATTGLHRIPATTSAWTRSAASPPPTRARARARRAASATCRRSTASPSAKAESRASCAASASSTSRWAFR